MVDWLKPTLSSGSMNLVDLALNAAVVVMLVGATLSWWRDRSPDGRAAPRPSR
jgi:hypothetical protein